MRELTYMVATSLDGYIASPEGTFDAFALEGDHIRALLDEYPETLPGVVLDAAGVSPSTHTFDTVIMGWNTYAVGLDTGLAEPYPHLRQYVCSRRHTPGNPGGNVNITDEDPVALVQRLKAQSSDSGIWLCGGGELAAALFSEIDCLTVKVNPVLLGSGIRLFATTKYDPKQLRLTGSRTFSSGVVMNHYQVLKGSPNQPPAD